MHEYRLLDPSKKNNGSILDGWVLCRIYKNLSTEKIIFGSPSTDRSHNSSSSSSSQFDKVLDSLPTIYDKFLNFPANTPSRPLKIRMSTFKSTIPTTMIAGASYYSVNNYIPPNATSIDPTFNMQMRFGRSSDDEVQTGIRTQLIENSDYL